MDTLTAAQRSENMRRIKSKGMDCELRVRKLVHAMGYRFRLHVKSLPGAPDLVFPSRRKIILVHGCFWHQHASSACKIARRPKSNIEYWTKKLDGNIQRDKKHLRRLRRRGWGIMVIWECQAHDEAALRKRIARFMETP